MMLNTLVIIFSLLFTVSVFAQQQPAQTLFGPDAVSREYEQQSKKDAQADVITRPKVEYSEVKRDPFEKVIIHKNKGETRVSNSDDGSSKSLIDSFSIQGLIWGGNFPQAIINNKVYKVGDTIQGATISNIDKSGIVFSLGGKKYILSSSSAGSAAKRN